MTNVALDLTHVRFSLVPRPPAGISAVATGTIGLSRLPAVIVQPRKLPVSLGFSLVGCSVAPSPKGPDDFRIVEPRLQAKCGDMTDAQQSEVAANGANEECVIPCGSSKPSQVRPRIAGGVARPPHWPAIKTIVTSSFAWRCQSWPTVA
jgi:hypothetical protein